MTLAQIQDSTTPLQTARVGAACEDVKTLHYVFDCLQRCFAGDYGEVPPEDAETNNKEVATGEGRILARYKARHKLEEDIYIICYFSASMPAVVDANYTMVMYRSEY